MTNFCACGRALKTLCRTGGDVLYCTVHGTDVSAKAKREKIGKYSGPSLKFKGGYENDNN